MTGSAFHPNLDRQSFAHLLETRFQFLQAADPKTISETEASLGTVPTRGRPVNEQALELFRYADAEHGKGATLEGSIERAMERYPDVRPRRRRTKKIAIPTQSDPEHKKTVLLAEFKRYRSRVNAGLDPNVSYSTNSFFEFVLTRQWQMAAAVFAKANKARRAKFCSRLNRIGSEKRE